MCGDDKLSNRSVNYTSVIETYIILYYNKPLLPI